MDTNSTAGSVFSSLSIFNKAEAQKARFEIICEGNLDIMIDASSNKKKGTFVSGYCRLTRDGRLTIDEDKKSSTFIVEECSIAGEETCFRLTALSEIDLKAANIEILCRAENELDAAKWLVGIECALRARLTQFQNEMDCARGRLGIVEIEDGSDPKMNTMKHFQCFYYQNSFRVKGLDGPQTSTLEVTDCKTDEINYPMCLILEFRGRKLICQTEDPDQFRRWQMAIMRDLNTDADPTEDDADIITGDLLIGPSDDNLIRVKAKYEKSSRMLETTDFAGVMDFFNVLRCTVVASRLKVQYQFTLTCTMPDLPNQPEMTLYILCPDGESTKRWIKGFSINMKVLQMLMKASIKEIELRRIFHKEGSGKDKRRNVDFEEVHELASMSPAEADAALSNKDDWTVSKLERLNQVILKMLAEPIMPFDKQKQMYKLGLEMGKSSNQEKYMPRVEASVDMMPLQSRELLELIATHVWRLTTYYRKTHSTSKANTPNTDETVWRRLTKYLFRINEQGFTPKEEEERAVAISRVLYQFQRKTVMILTKQGEKTSSNSKRKLMANTCKQQ